MSLPNQILALLQNMMRLPHPALLSVPKQGTLFTRAPGDFSVERRGEGQRDGVGGAGAGPIVFAPAEQSQTCLAVDPVLLPEAPRKVGEIRLSLPVPWPAR